MFTGLTGLVVILESVCGLFFLSRRKKKQVEQVEEQTPDLISRFVVDGSGRKLGESISVDGDVLIIKTPGSYLGVPLKHVEERDDVLQVKGLVSFEKAEELGREWQSKYSKLGE